MPCDYSKYPRDWKWIRARILERAGHRCEECGVPDRAIGYRDKNGTFEQLAACKANMDMAVEAASLDGCKVIEIVLTIAHLDDPDPMNCADENLAALCQRCHNRRDAPMRRVNAARTRERKRALVAQQQGQEVLF